MPTQATSCAAVVVNEELALKDYVKLALQGNYLQMRKLAEGGNQPNLNLSKVRGVELLLPSRAEQAEIVRRTGCLLAMAERLRLRCAAARQRAKRLSPAVLATAFRGELVPQNPTDEPAAALLARLRQDAANSPSPGRRRGRPPAA